MTTVKYHYPCRFFTDVVVLYEHLTIDVFSSD